MDELWSGVAVAGAPSVEGTLGLTHRGYVLFAFVLPLVAAAILEALIAVRSDAGGRPGLVVAGQCGLAASLLFTAWTRSPWGLTVGLALAGTSSGVACGAAQALLVTASRRDADRVMVRWSLFSAVGDILTPLVTATAVRLGYSYRAAMLAVGVVVCAQCVVSILVLRPSTSQVKAGEQEEDAEPPAETIRQALARARRLPRLWAWLFAAASCTLLDELVVALAVLRLDRDQGVSPALATASGVVFAAGSVVGAALTDRVVARVPRRTVLLTSACACACALAIFLASGSVAAACAALFVVGVTCAPHHPLALAAAYAELPGNPGTVQALGQLFVVLEIGAPLALGVVADRFGLRSALGCLVLQPVAIFVCAVAAGRVGRPRS